VTKQKQAEDALQESFEKLRKLEEVRDNLTNMIIHDLRSPLTVIMCFLELLKSNLQEKLDRGGMEAIEAALAGADQINAMITSLLDVSRLEAGQMPIHMSEVDLGELVTTSLAKELALYGKTIKLDFPQESILLQCDPVLISRVMANLLGNAIKFTPRDGEIRVKIKKDESNIVLSVADNGPGIPTEFQERVFEKFAQVEVSKHAHSSGLGLTFCKLAIKAQGGTIGITSENGNGATFWCNFPSGFCENRAST
jgi:signal transduction histidine kinase